MARSTRDRTILDAVESALGAKPTQQELRKLTVPELDEIAGRLDEFWRDQARQPIKAGASFIGGWRSSHGSEPSLRADLSDSLLYYSRLLLLDPLADFFNDGSVLPSPRGVRYRRPDGRYNTVSAGARIWSQAGAYESLREDRDMAAARFASMVRNLYSLEKLIREDIIVLRSQWPVLAQRGTQLDTAVRHDVQSKDLQDFIKSIPPDEIGLTAWDNLQGFAIAGDGPVHVADEKWRNAPFFYYLDKMLAVAHAFDAQFVPPTKQDLQFLRKKVTVGVHRMHPGAMLREVSDFLLPSIEVPIREAVAVRKSSDNFEEWRVGLQHIQHEASGDTEAELRDRVEEELLPRMNRVKRDLEKSPLSLNLRPDAINFVIDAAVGLAVADLTHQPSWGVATGATSGILHWIVKAYTRPKPQGADAVLATLLRDPA